MGLLWMFFLYQPHSKVIRLGPVTEPHEQQDGYVYDPMKTAYDAEQTREGYRRFWTRSDPCSMPDNGKRHVPMAVPRLADTMNGARPNDSTVR